MNTFFGSLIHVFAGANPVHWVWCAAILLMMLILAILHHRWRDDALKLLKWRLYCLLPLLIAAIHGLIYTSGCPSYTGAYVRLYAIPILALIPALLASRKTGYRIAASVTGAAAVLIGVMFCAMSPNIHNFTHKSYTASFHALVRTMDREYILKEWKEIDFAALEDKYMPMVREAEQEQDPAKFEDAVLLFCGELHDAHISVSGHYDYDAYPSMFDQHEYGMAMVRLDDGTVIAVCTTDAVNQLGIEDGTVITHWDGEPVLQAADAFTLDESLPVKSNADRLDVIELSGIGGDTVEVTFLDDSGKAQTATLTDQGEMHTLDAAFNAFAHAPDARSKEECQAFLDANYSARMLDDKIGCLVLNEETLPNDPMGIKTISGYLSGDMKPAREIFRERLNDLKSQGMEYLIIDLRNNMGGVEEIGTALCDLLTDEDWYACGLGVRTNGQYRSVSDHYVHGTGEFSDLKVVALTNYNCASAGDGAALYLSKLPNVTLAGMTDPCGINQETGGRCILSGGVVHVSYPTGLVLNEDAEPNVDTRADRISRNPVEVRIPLDYDAAMRIFRDHEDYELEWAMEYLKATE